MTDTYIRCRRIRAGSSGWLKATAAVALVAALSACSTSDLLDVPDPDVATPGSLEGSGSLDVIYNGAIGDFALAHDGNAVTVVADRISNGMVSITGLLADEFINAETFPTRIEIDQRNMTEENATLGDVLRLNQRARAATDFAASKFEEFAPADTRRAEMMSLSGFMITVMGEAYCSGMPLSRLTAEGATEFGEPRTTTQLFEDALAKFDSAITIASAGSGPAAATRLNLARVGKGRALLNLGQFAAAAAAVAQVPTSFQYLIFHSDNSVRENNGVWYWQRISNRFSVSDNEGINGLPYITADDPRVPVVSPATEGRAITGFDGTTLMWYQHKWPERGSPTILASGVEARLIEAEAALQANNAADYKTALNAALVQDGVEALATPAFDADELFRERAYALWMSAHRLGDLRRLIRQYGRDQASVFPTGAYHKGGTYGTDVNIPIAIDERNNPNFGGCIDRNA